MKKLLPLLLLAISTALAAQEDPMEVYRGNAIKYNAIVFNFHVDEANNKWAGTADGLYQVHNPTLATRIELAEGEESLLRLPGGNEDIRWKMEDLIAITGDIFDRSNYITAGHYDRSREELWIGTSQFGLYQFKAEPKLELIGQQTIYNSKLKSDHINTIYIDAAGRQWAGTKDGVLFGEKGRWQLLQRGYDIRAVAGKGLQIWLMTEEEVGPLDSRQRWEPIDIPRFKTEGRLRGITFDDKGNLWIASEVITRYNPETREFTVFGPAQEYTSQFASCLAADRDNAVWVGTQDKGLYIIDKASALRVAALVDREVSCNGNGRDAALKVEVYGGQGPYTYQWSGGLAGPNPQNLAPGEYQLTVTDAKGKSKATRAVIEDRRVEAVATITKKVSAAGAADGSATANVKGGTLPYAFRWDNGETTATAVRLPAGQQSVTVTDQAGCQSVSSLTITQELAELAAGLTLAEEIRCFGGRTATLEVDATGGQEPYSFQWNQPGLAGARVKGLPAGEYSVTITDAAGNSAVAQTSIPQPDALSATATATAPASTGKADGQARVNAQGGVPAYLFEWDNGEKGENSDDLAVGTHTVTVTDANGCSATASVTISEDILPLALAIRQTAEINCFGGKEAALQVQASGGKGPFQYQWDADGLAGEAPTGLAAGQYSVTVTDVTGTTQSASFSVTQPEALKAEAEVTAPASTNNSDGQAVARAAGGTAPYTYRWPNGETAATALALAPGVHTVTATDANGCTATASLEVSENILPLTAAIEQTAQIGCHGGQTAAIQLKVKGGKGPFRYQWNDSRIDGESAAGLPAGQYSVTVEDVLGSTQSARIEIAQPEILTAGIAAKEPAFSDTSNDGKATAEAKGGSGSYTFRWDNGETGPRAEALSLGQHSLTVTDGNGCTATATFEITERIMKELASGAVRSGQTIQMQKLQFEADSTNITEDNRPILDEIYVFLKDNPSIVVEIGGHTNNLPPPEYCDQLSTARARAVAEYLVQQGIDPERVFYKGYGKRKPLFSNATEDGRRRNQRVEVKILRL
ncbi:MAG: OmpA family protein [Phaeodactylibacter sp.]|nr:OmpA family protein [Phaeodactylibacter sp.]